MWIPIKELEKKQRESYGWDQPVLQLPVPPQPEPQSNVIDGEKTERGIWTIDI